MEFCKLTDNNFETDLSYTGKMFTFIALQNFLLLPNLFSYKQTLL